MSIADAGSIKATLDFDASSLDASVNKAMQKAAGTITSSVDKSMNHVESSVKSSVGNVSKSIIGFFGISDLTSGFMDAGKFILNIGKTTEEALNQFQAVSGATSHQMEEVEKQAIALGNDLSLPGVSAVDAAQGMSELAKAGFTVEESMSAAKGVLQLSTAAQVSAGEAATIAASAIHAFGLEASDAGHVADVLANAANRSAADITGISDSLQQSEAVAHAAGLGLTETASAIALMANNSIQGSDAGTSLKTMLVALEKPTSQAQNLMRKLGINVYDSDGKMKSLADIVDSVAGGLEGASDKQRQFALATIFGTDAVRAINVLLNEGGDGLREMEAGLDKEGAAAKLAAANSKGFGGALEALKSNIESVAIQIYNEAEPAMDRWLRGALEHLPGALEKIGQGAHSVEEGIAPLISIIDSLVHIAGPGVLVGLGGALEVVAVVAKSAGMALGPLADIINANESALTHIISPLIAATIAYKLFTRAVSVVSTKGSESMWKLAYGSLAFGQNLNKAGGAVGMFKTKAAGMFDAMGGPWGIAIAAITVAIGVFAAKSSEAKAKAEELGNTLDSETGAITKDTKAWVANELAKAGAFAKGKLLGISEGDLLSAALGMGDALPRVNQLIEDHKFALNSSGSAANKHTAAEVEMSQAASQLDEILNGTNSAISQHRHQTQEATSALHEHADALKGASAAADTYKAASHALREGDSGMAIATKKAADSMQGEAKEAYHARDAVLALKSAELKGLNAKLDFAQATIDLKKHMHDLTAENHRNKSALNLNTQAGIDTWHAFLNVAQSAKGVQGGMAKARAQIFQAALALTGSKKEALAVTNQFFKLKGAADRVPHDVRTHVHADGVDTAIGQVDHLSSALVALTQRTWTAKINAVKTGEGHAYGGPIIGPGTATSDSILTPLSNGEHVWTAAEVDAAGGHAAVRALRDAALHHRLGRAVAPRASEHDGGGSGPLVGALSISTGKSEDLKDALDETLFHLRRIKRGGRYKTT